MIRDHVGGASAFNDPYIECARANLRVVRQLDGAHALECGKQFFNSGFAELWIGRVRHPAAGSEQHTQRTLGCDGNSVLRRFAVDQETTAQWALVGRFRADGVAFFADQEQYSDRSAFPAQALASCDLRSNNSLGVARTTPVNVLAILRRW